MGAFLYVGENQKGRYEDSDRSSGLVARGGYQVCAKYGVQ
ncbi:hypothetical protein JCM19232_4767 [Vibrio ishigakensis]|uniref:Uncharacterized protein n=1 Tax=Vibrio ishigakensis TaxID=1481914 RepID=A0A0B8P8B4_9VIBR|nr:hypothetical protein JCM19232_4767 [Vibrio ishigakensis]